MTLSTSLSAISTIKKFHLARLKKLGIETVEDLLRHFPSRYEDFSRLCKIEEVEVDNNVTVEGRIVSFDAKQSWRKRLLVSTATLKDDTGQIKAVWFGQKFLDKMFVPGRKMRLSGRVVLRNGEFLFQSPEFEPASKNATHTGALVPIYGVTEGVTSKWIRWQIQTALQHVHEFPDPLPREILAKLHLPDLKTAIRYVHFPKSHDHATLALKRFAFEEMFLLQVRSLRAKELRNASSAPAMPLEAKKLKSFLDTLPFKLTPDQSRAIDHIMRDLGESRPMNRLLNGDVGSGKTVVAMAGAWHAGVSGYQTALLAPTEVLAFQHFESMRSLLGKTGLSVGLLTHAYQYIAYPGTKEADKVKRPTFLSALKNGLVDIVIGTHALLQDDIQFKNLALIVVDEQHRFGVMQRAYLTRTNTDKSPYVPHLLSMTATPIPRTLSLAFFGNLDISLLETMPSGRKPIITKIISPAERDHVYEFIRTEIAKGRQAYIILPLVEESSAIKNAKAVVEEHKHLQKEIFPNLKLGLMHGRLKAPEKEKVMRDFKEKKLDMLISTSVVEVGVDVPNSTLMIIENADRFGLSQLHQFRGRIGRGKHQSYCFLFASTQTDTDREQTYADKMQREIAPASRRMRILEKSNDGFKIAKEDMKLRGPGQFLGTRQSGLPDIAMENISNIKLVTIAREEAENLLAHDPELSHSPELKKTLKAFDERVHME